MAHTYESTLLARLGFCDPDRKNPLHESACRYLTSPSGRADLVAAIGPPDFDFPNPKANTCQHVRNETTSISSERERTLSKGKGQYRTAIGFLDAVVYQSYQARTTITNLTTGKVLREEVKPCRTPYVIEVKIHEESIGQILRQVNLYRAFINDQIEGDQVELSGYEFVLATRYLPTREDLATLEDAGIIHVVLGDGFDRYLEAQANVEREHVVYNTL